MPFSKHTSNKRKPIFHIFTHSTQGGYRLVHAFTWCQLVISSALSCSVFTSRFYGCHFSQHLVSALRSCRPPLAWLSENKWAFHVWHIKYYYINGDKSVISIWSIFFAFLVVGHSSSQLPLCPLICLFLHQERFHSLSTHLHYPTGPQTKRTTNYWANGRKICKKWIKIEWFIIQISFFLILLTYFEASLLQIWPFPHSPYPKFVDAVSDDLRSYLYRALISANQAKAIHRSTVEFSCCLLCCCCCRGHYYCCYW